MPASYEIATEKSQAVLEMRRRLGELAAPALDSVNSRLHGIPSHLVQREAFIADRGAIVDSWQGERAWPRKGERG